LPLTSTKGEYVTIKAPNLKETSAIKSSIFLIPWEKDLYRVGATYKWKDTTNIPTEESRIELLQKLDDFLKCDYEVVLQLLNSIETESTIHSEMDISRFTKKHFKN